MRSREVAKEHVTKNQSARTSPASATLPVMDGEAVNRALRRIAHEIIERNPDLGLVILAGIPSRGVEIARRIAEIVQSLGRTPIETGVIDVSMHRDDVGTRAELPRVQASRLPLPLENKTVIIVDDVFFTGRTARAAMDAISSFGRPARIQLATLIDRGHRELPIRVDYVGKNLPTAPGERVRLRLENVDGEPDAVWLVKEEKA
jgi:pyrimidine operon attenuation protein / uracil phosphoribosyltransferase